MPAPTITIEITDTASGRRAYVNQTEQAINMALANLFDLIQAIPAGDQGDQGDIGPTGPAWIVGSPREFAVGLTCVVGNAVFRRFDTEGVTGLFRCVQDTTTTEGNFPSTTVSNSSWELVLIVNQGPEGPASTEPGPAGDSAEIVEFASDAEAEAYVTANELAIAFSTARF